MLPAASTAAPCAAPASGNFADDVALQIAHDGAGDDTPVAGHRQSRDAAGAFPLGQEFPVRVEHLNALIVAIGHVDPSLCVDDDVMRQAEFAGPVPRLPHSSRYLPSRENFTTRAPP